MLIDYAKKNVYFVFDGEVFEAHGDPSAIGTAIVTSEEIKVDLWTMFTKLTKRPDGFWAGTAKDVNYTLTFEKGVVTDMPTCTTIFANCVESHAGVVRDGVCYIVIPK